MRVDFAGLLGLFLVFSFVMIAVVSAPAKADEPEVREVIYKGRRMIIDASYFMKAPRADAPGEGVDFHHTHFNSDEVFAGPGQSFRTFCRDRIDGTVPDKDYSDLFSRLRTVVSYFEGQGYKDIKVNVVSCFRSAHTNGIVRASSLARNGGTTGVAKNSQHTNGTAMDFFLTSGGKMIPIAQTVDITCAIARQHGSGGIGKYPGWVHADTREGIAQWGGVNCRDNAKVDALLGGY